MKIVFLASGTVNSNFSYRIVALAEALDKRGFETAIIAPSADKYNGFRQEKIRKLNGVKIIQPFQFRTKRQAINLIPYLFGVARAVLREKPDLVYIYKPTPISAIGLVAKWLRGTPVATDMDDIGSAVMKIEGRPSYQVKLVELSERMATAQADRLVTASAYLFDLYSRRFPGRPVHLMPNGIDSSWLVQAVQSREARRIVFMGAINRKNILEPLFEAMPDAIKRFPDARLLVIGDGKYLPYFKEKALLSGIQNNVSFTGWLDISSARDHLQYGDIGYSYMPLDPTTKAASNMKISQYMARGVVPLVSNENDLAQRNDFGTMGYAAAADSVPALLAAMLGALNDGERKAKAGQARLFAEEHFRWDILAASFGEFLIAPRIAADNDMAEQKA